MGRKTYWAQGLSSPIPSTITSLEDHFLDSVANLNDIATVRQ